MRGEKSLHGDASLDDAVLEPPPGDCMGETPPPTELSSVGIIKESPVAEDDLTIAVFCLAPPIETGEADLADAGEDVMTSGLGVTGSTDPLADMGRLLGPLLVSLMMVGIGEFIPDEGESNPDRWPSSMEMENLGKAALAT